MRTRARNGHDSRLGNGGFTLIEVLVTMAIIAIAAAIALPGFRDTLMASNAKSLSGDLVAALNLARNEAVKRGSQVAVTGEGTDWSTGWTVQTGSEVLQRYPQVAAGYAVGSSVETVTFNATGTLAGTADITINVCPTADSTQSRQVTIRPAGVIRTVRTTASCT